MADKLKKQKSTSFMGNVIMILFAQIMVKLLGLVYRMVITNIDGFGDIGNGFLNAGFQVYTVLLAISSVGIPNAIAKMVAERAALGDYKSAHRIFKTSFLLFSIIGLICSVILYLGSDFIAIHIMNMDGAQYVMRALAPSIFFVCISSVIRGYFQGLNDLRATSYSQILEQIFKCGLTVGFVLITVGSMPYLFELATKFALHYSMDGVQITPPEILAAWGNVASSVAAMISFAYLAVFYLRRKKGLYKKIQEASVDEMATSTGKLMKMILMLSIPISLASIITAINRVVDLATITRGIEAAFAGGIPAGVISPSAILGPTAEQLNKAAVTLSGMLSKSDTIFNMPLALNIAFATVLVPSIAGALAKGDTQEASSKTSYSFLISLLLILPCAIGLMTLSQPIYNIIYPNASTGAYLLSIMSIALIFSALTQTLTGALQGIGKVFIPAIGILSGCLCKVILNLTLIRIPEINITGAAISSIVCQVVAFLINFFVLIRYVPLKITLSKYIIKPLISGGIMGVASLGVFNLLHNLLGAGYISNLISTIASVAVAAIVYISLIFLLKTMDESDIELLPGGKKLYSLLKKFKLYK